ncbi:uncharacterized protein LOC117792376 isoform X1 [Drosophila innubila]|uniref:uncharacterized protein LOC117792376 isoform X1 n=1 Tax=Drosophila innubila TaxID=198719 RepID=UPI00148B6BFC|nr:uncharacterized protein LOC117792376 isoform X1 [Drosophila innubila]XP_034488388.1 uncharacterized protein LOC117792376 isoform X1 [Drosophila innubila]XP_034488389.1 uncharacterized protein LOC117792376 isoform X1 [Drosophila innubila]XP_034488390.1 uncharacterized protein LOC117792376 isoform X1 [Drosophila innubila]
MSGLKFLVVVPTNPEADADRMTKFLIHGSLLQEPQQFSINFVNSPSCTDNITYHFKVKIPEQMIVENYKSDGEWSASHQEKYLNIFDGNTDKKISDTPSIKNGIDAVLNYSSTETAFSLMFQLDRANSTIDVYQVRGNGHNFVTKYETLFSLSEIQSIQVWGDVKKINQFSLSYD